MQRHSVHLNKLSSVLIQLKQSVLGGKGKAGCLFAHTPCLVYHIGKVCFKFYRCQDLWLPRCLGEKSNILNGMESVSEQAKGP